MVWPEFAKLVSARTCRFDSCLLRLRFAVARQSVGELLQKLRRDAVRQDERKRDLIHYGLCLFA